MQRAALGATLDLVDNPRIGYRGLTMEAVARRAGISKATLYRWWPSKAHLPCEAYVAKANRDIPLPGTGDLGEDLREYLRHIAFALSHLGTGRTIAEVILAANVDPAFGDRYRHTLLADASGASATCWDEPAPPASCGRTRISRWSWTWRTAHCTTGWW